MMSRVLFFLALLGFGSCAGALSQFAQDIPVSRGLIARWDIEEGTGTTSTRDETGNGYTATLANISEGDWGAGPIPSRYWLDTLSGGGYLVVADADVFSFTDGSTTNYPFSAEVCANPSSTNNNVLMAKFHSGLEWVFQLSSNALQLWVDGANLKEVQDATVSAGTLHSFGFSYDGDQTVTLYIDGSPLASTTTGTAGIITNSSSPLYIGSADNATSYSTKGPLAFAQIYGVELTQEEHAEIAKECRE